MVRAAAHMNYKFDDIRSKAVEKLIFSLIDDVTNITETFPLKAGQSPDSLVVGLERSIGRFTVIGNNAIQECPLAEGDALSRLHSDLLNVRDTGQVMIGVSRDFIRDSSNSKKRASAVEAGRGLLQAIARLLISADMVDITLLIDGIDRIRGTLESLKNSSSNQEVIDRYSIMMAQIEELEETIKKRIRDMRDPQQSEYLLAARAMLKSSCPVVESATRAFVRHPESELSRMNRDFGYAQTDYALNALQEGLSGIAPERSFWDQGPLHNLAALFDEFQSKVYMDPMTYRRDLHRPALEKLVEEISTASGTISVSESTRFDRKKAISDGCNNVRQAVQDLLEEYERNRSRGGENSDVDLAMVQVGKKTKDLRRQLRRAVLDHVSDAFLDTSTPLLSLIYAAESRNEDDTRHCAKIFQDHADMLVKVSYLACDMSSDVEGVRIISYTANELQKLAPEVINAALLLCKYGDSPVAKKNMAVFKESWERKVGILTMAIDSLMTLDDFLAVSEGHIIEDHKHGEQAILDRHCDLLDRAAGAIRGRALRVCQVVDTEMDALPASTYTDRIKMATRKLRDDKLEEFSSRSQAVISSVEQVSNEDNDEQKYLDSDEFTSACTMIHEAVREIRNALLINRLPEDVDSDNEYEDDGQTVHDNNSRVSEGDNQQRLMRRLPEVEKKRIEEHCEVFRITHSVFEREVAKWDESGNDIIRIAREMSAIMLEMTNFTRGHGSLKTTMDVIAAAQKISILGAKLQLLAQQIGDESADSHTKNDLSSHLSKIPTYCTQLNICSKVKADVQQVGDNLVVSGLESATTLIQTAKNLLSTVVATVKSAYIASTKFRKPNSTGPRVEWRMVPPQRQPLVRPERQRNTGVIRRASERRPMRPEQVLAEFVH